MAATTGAAGLTDTDILVDASRGVADAARFLTVQRAARGVHVSIVSAMELVRGCRNAAELKEVQRFLQRMAVLPVSTTASQIAYQLMESFFLSHGLLIPDALIAATALEQELTLYTKNTRHFQMIPGLTIVRPY